MRKYVRLLRRLLKRRRVLNTRGILGRDHKLEGKASRSTAIQEGFRMG